MTYVWVFLLLALLGWVSEELCKEVECMSLCPQDVLWLEAQCVRAGLPPSAWK